MPETNVATSPVRQLSDLLQLYRTDPRVARIADTLREKAARVQVAGTIGSSQALIAQAVMQQAPGVHVFVLNDREEAAYFLNDLEALGGKEREGDRVKEKKGQELYFFPAPSRTPYDPDGHHDGERVSRTEVLEALMQYAASPSHSPTLAPSLCIVTYPEALVPLVVAKETMAKNTLTIKRGEELPIDTLEEWMHETGFRRVDFVYEPGQFSIRGGIVDVFSYGSDRPFRIELFGDTVESVRRFSPEDQLTVEFLAEAVIVPDMQEDEAGSSQLFFDQLPEDAVIWLGNMQALGDAAKARLKLLTEAYERSPEKEKHAKPETLLATDSALIKGLLGFRKVFFRSDDQMIRRSDDDRHDRSSNHLIDPSSDQHIEFALRPQPA
ncbi:MAG: hypothetical protein JSU02_11335, partial [Bacteroidetes bacterium]|nr:hypothetical protein [Bacteroidota bacterium]